MSTEYGPRDLTSRPVAVRIMGVASLPALAANPALANRNIPAEKKEPCVLKTMLAVTGVGVRRLLGRRG